MWVNLYRHITLSAMWRKKQITIHNFSAQGGPASGWQTNFKLWYLEFGACLEIVFWCLLFASHHTQCDVTDYRVLPHLSMSYSRLSGTFPLVTTPFATSVPRFAHHSADLRGLYAEGRRHDDLVIVLSALSAFSLRVSALCRKKWDTDVRLACLIHAASVHPELGSNSK